MSKPDSAFISSIEVAQQVEGVSPETWLRQTIETIRPSLDEGEGEGRLVQL